MSKGHQRLELKCLSDFDINVSRVDGGFARLMLNISFIKFDHVHAGFL